MITALGIMTAAGGLFLFLWYRTIVGLPRKQQPSFIRPYAFRWGVPGVSVALFASGIFLIASVSAWSAVAAIMLFAVLAYLIIALDRYSAIMRLLRDHYRSLRADNPSIGEEEALYQTARWRYPDWSHDRLVELVAGKDLESLVLLMIINENGVNPISDWELYRNLKLKAARIIRAGI